MDVDTAIFLRDRIRSGTRHYRTVHNKSYVALELASQNHSRGQRVMISRLEHPVRVWMMRMRPFGLFLVEKSRGTGNEKSLVNEGTAQRPRDRSMCFAVHVVARRATWAVANPRPPK